MLRSVVLMLALSLAGLPVAAAQPSGLTYLECDSTQEGKPVHYSITLNEARGSADWTGPTSRRVDAAQFTAAAVYFFDFKISRVDLTMQRRYADMLGNPESETGQCKIATQQNRAF
jgi:hypothetical protein